jgi:hypothetical protein
MYGGYLNGDNSYAILFDHIVADSLSTPYLLYNGVVCNTHNKNILEQIAKVSRREVKGNIDHLHSQLQVYPFLENFEDPTVLNFLHFPGHQPPYKQQQRKRPYNWDTD